MTAKRPLDPTQRNPMVMPDGTVIPTLVYLNRVVKHPRIEIGDFTYFGPLHPIEDPASALAPYLFPPSPERLVIGKFCQIAHGVRFITSSANHAMSGFSTYPFDTFRMTKETTPEETTALFQISPQKGDTMIGNDVWIGMDAKIMPGVTVGDGAIIGTGAVVTTDVLPYTIVGGNPAKTIRNRFDPETTKILLEIRWWDWPIAKVEANLDAIKEANLNALRRA